MSELSLNVTSLSKRYGDFTALGGVSLQARRGDYVVLLGPSGSGKTSLLSLIGGFTMPTDGQIQINGQDVTYLDPAERPTSTVFQDYALFPHMSIQANVEFGLAMQGVSKSERRTRALKALETVGLAEHAHKGIQEVSGGQRQRVALARALVVEPHILLLDEPLGALDLNLRRQMQDELLAIQRNSDRTFIHVTHDQEEAMALATLLVVMNKGQIEDMGEPERIYHRPASRFTAAFMGESNMFEGTVIAVEADMVRVHTAIGDLCCKGDAPFGSQVSIMVRPENIATQPGESLKSLGTVVVDEVVFQGAFKRVFAHHQTDPAQKITLRLPHEMAVHSGQTLEIACSANDLVLLTR